LNWTYIGCINLSAKASGRKKIIDILTSLGFKIEKKEKILSVQIPTWRATKDISIKEDLAEEIARINGYDNLEPEMQGWKWNRRK